MATKKKSKKAVRGPEMMAFSLHGLVTDSDPSEKFLTVADAGRIRGTTRIAILHLIERGRLPATKIAGRYLIKLSDLKAFEPMTHRQKFDAEAEGWFDGE